MTILREKGYAAGATNEFDRTLDLFGLGQLDLVIFGGMVSPDTGKHLREQIAVVEVYDGNAAAANALAGAVEATAHGYAMLLIDGEYG